MPNSTINSPEASADAGGRRFQRLRLRLLGAAFLIVALVLAISWRLLLPESPLSAPGTLTERDKREIAALCRRHTIRTGAERLKRGEFRWFLRSARVVFQQKIDRLIADRDGTYRAYVVVYDKQAPDGFNPWYRHQLVKTNGLWTILRSY